MFIEIVPAFTAHKTAENAYKNVDIVINFDNSRTLLTIRQLISIVH